ncbi:hypothetical protein WCQ02_37760 [Paraburkholderia tropica]|uniref:hypothetical protein n=1 Tax=Paraburkholderia tropica TaxID=92647 RepID=UPI000D772668|nr:hypothetical protein [Paraburkholderia tropica]
MQKPLQLQPKAKNMPILADELSHLFAANEHLRAAWYRISCQEVRLAQCRAAGRDAEQFQQLLDVMLAIFRSFLVQRQMVCDAIELESGRLPGQRYSSSCERSLADNAVIDYEPSAARDFSERAKIGDTSAPAASQPRDQAKSA